MVAVFNLPQRKNDSSSYEKAAFIAAFFIEKMLCLGVCIEVITNAGFQYIK